MSPQQLVRSDFTPTYSHFTPHTFNRSVSPLWFELEFKLQINLGSPRSHQIPWCVLFLRIAISLLEKEVSHIFYPAALLQTDKTAAETAMTMKWKWQCRNGRTSLHWSLSFFFSGLNGLCSACLTMLRPTSMWLTSEIHKRRWGIVILWHLQTVVIKSPLNVW